MHVSCDDKTVMSSFIFIYLTPDLFISSSPLIYHVTVTTNTTNDNTTHSYPKEQRGSQDQTGGFYGSAQHWM